MVVFTPQYYVARVSSQVFVFFDGVLCDKPDFDVQCYFTSANNVSILQVKGLVSVVYYCTAL